MKELLEMIEAVDPSDTAKLDEIDARVWVFLDKKKRRIIAGKIEQFISDDGYGFEAGWYGVSGSFCLKYTRSRDALKAIRPNGWQWYASANRGMVTFVFHKGLHANPEAHGADLPTEELAELHAIIQAISYERQNA